MLTTNVRSLGLAQRHALAAKPEHRCLIPLIKIANGRRSRSFRGNRKNPLNGEMSCDVADQGAVSHEVYNEPAEVAAEKEVVLVTGPGGVVVSLTAEAAAETSDRLLDGATEALGQRLERERLEAEIKGRRLRE